MVIAGMGGSAIGGDVVRLLLSSYNNIPITVSRNYNLPSWVDENSLVICSSYSGNTEETLSSFDDAKNKNDYQNIEIRCKDFQFWRKFYGFRRTIYNNFFWFTIIKLQ